MPWSTWPLESPVRNATGHPIMVFPEARTPELVNVVSRSGASVLTYVSVAMLRELEGVRGGGARDALAGHGGAWRAALAAQPLREHVVEPRHERRVERERRGGRRERRGYDHVARSGDDPRRASRVRERVCPIASGANE